MVGDLPSEHANDFVGCSSLCCATATCNMCSENMVGLGLVVGKESRCLVGPNRDFVFEILMLKV